MRTIGMLVLDRVAERMTEVLPTITDATAVIRCGKASFFGLSNSEVAAMILTDWRFPPDIVGAVREHYLMHSADYENKFA